ncbi:MAG TPA: acyl-CoA thioester hydrolase/BAAT C-terminal domain-containing protein [Caulobacteraceae bacterium]|nr:acyl-CoA thioester hydrolase/BAAT C-terminal domain-containing protein [Caulobacteraceae bacterium]
MQYETTQLAGETQGVLLAPERPNGLGVVVLHGSSGRVGVERAALFARGGAFALAQKWFGGEGQAPAICEIPLETFGRAGAELTARGCDRIAMAGTSRGAEAALLAASFGVGVDVEAVIAFSPSSLVWPCIYRSSAGDRWIQSASWTHHGEPLAFVPYDEAAFEATQKAPPVPWLALFETSLATAGDHASTARIPIESFGGEVVLVAGEDDRVWPSARFARELARRLADSGRASRLVTHPKAGHRVLLPGETTPRSEVNLHGGTDEADMALGRQAWAAICETLGLAQIL